MIHSGKLLFCSSVFLWRTFFPFYLYVYILGVSYFLFVLFVFFFLFSSTARLKTQHTVYDTCNLHLKCKDSLQDNSRHSSRYSINTLNFITKREGSRREKDFLKTVNLVYDPHTANSWDHMSAQQFHHKCVCDFEITWKVGVWPAIPAIVGT